jgi:hypothetical protein
VKGDDILHKTFSELWVDDMFLNGLWNMACSATQPNCLLKKNVNNCETASCFSSKPDGKAADRVPKTASCFSSKSDGKGADRAPQKRGVVLITLIFVRHTIEQVRTHNYFRPRDFLFKPLLFARGIFVVV